MTFPRWLGLAFISERPRASDMPRLPPGTSAGLQPLHVDTDTAYSLDMTMFPGLDSPEHKHQPALLIGTPENVAQYERHIWSDIADSHGYHQPLQRSLDMPVYKETAGNSCIIQPVPTVMTTRDLLEELLHIIDSTKSDLLDRILDSSLQCETTQDTLSMSTEDTQYSTYGIPHQHVHRHHYVHACSHYQQDTKRNVPLRNTCSDSNTPHSNDVLYSIPDYLLNLSALSHQGQNVNSRKRFMDDGDNVSQKRGCYAVNTREYVNLNTYDFVNEQYNVFHENMQNIKLVM